MTEIILLTYDKLFDIIQGNRFINKVDKKIAEKILEVENDFGDWKTSVKNWNKFILLLEKEINGKTTKLHLEKLLIQHKENLSKFTWETETSCSLLKVFELTNKTELREVFHKLIKKLKAK